MQARSTNEHQAELEKVVGRKIEQEHTIEYNSNEDASPEEVEPL